MTTPIKPISPVAKVPARAKRPIGRTCLSCQGRGWTWAPTQSLLVKPGIEDLPKRRQECHVCQGKGRVVV